MKYCTHHFSVQCGLALFSSLNILVFLKENTIIHLNGSKKPGEYHAYWRGNVDVQSGNIFIGSNKVIAEAQNTIQC